MPSLCSVAALLDADGRCRIEVVREVVAGRLHLVHRFRQLLCVPPRRLGGPLWLMLPILILTATLCRFGFRRPARRLSFCA